MSSWWRLLLLSAAMGCGAQGEQPPAALPNPEVKTQARADSLVLTAPGGVTVWLTEGRQGRDSSGVACLERTIEIRRDTVRLKVPLLYTRTVPVLVDDTSMRAELSRDCRPFASYRVGFSDGMPHKITP